MKKQYCVVVRDEKVYVVGPFKNLVELGKWATSSEVNPNDDPRWQSVMLSDEDAATGFKVSDPSELVYTL